MSHEVRGTGQAETLRQVGALLSQAKELTGAEPDRTDTKLLDYMLSLALLEVETPTKEWRPASFGRLSRRT